MNILVCRWDHRVVEALLKRDFQVTLVLSEWEEANREIDPELLAQVHHRFTIRNLDSLYDLAQLAVQIQARNISVDHVLNITEYSQFATAYLAAAFGHEHPAVMTSIVTRDKRAMKSRILAAGIPCARYAPLDVDDVAGSVARVSEVMEFPIIVKPATGSGSVGTQVVETAERLAALLDEAGEREPQHLMAEDLIHGEEFHANAVWIDGKPTFFGVGRYHINKMLQGPGGSNGSIIVPPEDEPELYRDIEKLHYEINTALGITDGITHLEFFRGPDGTLYFNEIATRWPGGGIPECYTPLGADLREAWLDSLTGTARARKTLGSKEHPYVGWLNFAPLEAGTIVAEPTDEQIAQFPYVLDTVRVKRVGDSVGELNPSLWCLWLIVGAKSEQEFRARAAILDGALMPEYKVDGPA